MFWNQLPEGPVHLVFSTKIEKKIDWSVRMNQLGNMGLTRNRELTNGKVEIPHTDNQASEKLIKQNQAYRQYSAPLARGLDKLAHFIFSIKFAAGKSIKLYEFLSGNPKKEVSTEGKYEGEFVINIPSEFFKFNHNTFSH